MNQRILIVDDDKILCEELSDYFQGEGFLVKYVTTPTEGVELLSNNNYDVLLLDFKMPQFNGIEFLERSREKIGNMRIFIMSGSLAVRKMLEEQNLSALVTGVFVKPFDVRALLSAINDTFKL
jgi:DNA-binding response OmpR family regulator